MNFGKNLQYLRRLSKNLTQEELTEKLNVSRQTVSFSTIPDPLKRGGDFPPPFVFGIASF
ncbi:MAG: helix-turn-helix domain-containing protein [Spirochaetia bacterium]|nr:helix-turn-helix domain-containing protein [Spirochaetia bacterium]